MKSKSQKRLNARLEGELAKKFEFLQKNTQHNATDVIRAALELYYEVIISEQTHSKSALFNSKFIGCLDDDVDLSQNYKRLLSRSLKAKL